MIPNAGNKFMESDLNKVSDTNPTQSEVVSTYFKAYFHFQKFLQSQQEAVYLVKVIKSVQLKSWDVSDHLQSQPGTVE